MKRSFKKQTLILAAGLCSALSMPAAQACDGDTPMLASVCIMATARNTSFNGGMYIPANGQLLQVGQNQALFSLIGATYGGNGTSNFNLPDLRGRVEDGSGPGTCLPHSPVAAKGAAVTLTSNQLPPHAHTLTTAAGKVVVSVGIGTLAANTSMTGLTATTTLTNVTANTTLSDLTLKAYSGNGGSSSASGAALATANGPASKIYANSAPDVSMVSGSITGSAATTLSGNPTTTISGNPTTSITGVPAVAIGGVTDPVGSSSPFMPPYLAMTYYIAAQGLYPAWD